MAKLTLDFNVPDDKLNEFKARFLRAVPMPQEETFEDGIPTGTQDKYTFLEHLRLFVLGRIKGEVIQGKRLLDAETQEEITIT